MISETMLILQILQICIMIDKLITKEMEETCYACA